MDYKKYYFEQAGSGFPVFSGVKIQKGYGLGNLFRSFYRWFQPIIKTQIFPKLQDTTKMIGHEALLTAANIAKDTLAGKNLRESFKERSNEVIDNIVERVEKKSQTGLGIKKRKKKHLKHKFKKRNKQDIFDNEFSS